uniref:Outer dynein arm-docking complex subunit 4 n=1 Tax=Astyanax mexicanus TaxID=7994 RepID=A0A8B9LEM1_ASTMX
MSDNEGEQGPKSTFSIYIAEGEQLFNKREYTKAIQSYSTALTLQPEDKNCLVARSKCYVKLGDSENALKDAEASLKEDKKFFKGLYQKAEALYTKGEFEFALIFYHRGHKLRPELQEFRLGIQKAQEAINNSVGSPSSVKLENTSDLSLQKADELKKVPPKPVKKVQLKQQAQKTVMSERTARQLLGELYTDKEHLEKLLRDEDLIKGKTRNGERLQDVILNCISYLDTRTEFWHQQKPIYARQRDQKLLRQQWKRTRNHLSTDPTRYILKNLEEIDAALSAGKTKKYLKKAQEVLKNVHGWSEEVLPNKSEVLENLHSCIGNALMDLDDVDKALENYQKALDLSQEGKLIESISRALDNIGRAYTRVGKFQQAIEAWEKRIPMVQEEQEKAWLFHEIGRCYLELQRHTEARDYGVRSLSMADDIGDEKWQLNASVLVAQLNSLIPFKTLMCQTEANVMNHHSGNIQLWKELRNHFKIIFILPK